jgi:formate-dependent nitrite reductase membrane component NrfD
VSLYIWTKSLAAGAFLVSALGVGAGLVPDSPLLTWGALLLALLFLGITGVLLILDLKRPERFYTILLRPQWRSWLTIGAYILVVYGALLGLSFLAALFGATGFRHFLLWPGGLGAILAAIYTGFLFGQDRGH